VNDLVPADERIRLLHLDRQCQIGEKRNFGCEQARGEIVAHWDDDDWSAPERLADQVQRIIESGKPVTGYRSMRFTDGQKWWMYEGSPKYIIGTSLCYRIEWWHTHRFASIQVGEDGRFVDEANSCQAALTVDAVDMMWATIHSGNTSPRDKGSSNWKEINT
jgi:glycosyltransferase involved in cell wall biosynthesis